MGSCRHLFSSVAVMAMVGAACTGGSSDGSVGGQGGAGGTGASNEASAAGSSSSSSSAQGGSAGHSTSHSAAGSGGLRASGGTAGSGGSSSRISSSGGTISSGGTSSSGMAGSGGNSSRTYSSSSYTPRCHNLGTGGMTELTGTFSYTGPIGGAGGTRSSGNVGGTAGSSRSNMGGTTSRNSSGSGGTTGTGDTACTPEQLAVRPASKYTVLGWADLPNDIQTFMTSVLPLSYIQDHIRFYSSNSVTPGSTFGWVNLQLEYGCETVIGFIDWSGTCKDGKLRILNWNGPSQAQEIKVDRAEATRRITDAGCDPSNLTLSLLPDSSTVRMAFDCDERASYPPALVWLAGLQNGVCPPGMPSPRCTCYNSQCQLNVETGELKVTPGSFSCPACH